MTRNLSRRTARRVTVATVALGVLLLPTAAWACGFLVAENGAIRLERFTALAAWVDDTHHYVTSFAYGGEVASFGAIVPLPAEPTVVEKAGSWTLQRLKREVSPPPELRLSAESAVADGDNVEVIATYEVEALDIAILRGGAQGVLDWTADNGFDLGVAADTAEDAVELLAFYAARSPYFAAIRYDIDRAEVLERGEGDGTPVHFAFEGMSGPWVPLRILAFDKPGEEIVQADIFLLTPEQPHVFAADQLAIEHSAPATAFLLDDLRDDENSDWIPTEGWLTYINIAIPAQDLTFDLAVSIDGDPVRAGSAYGPSAMGELVLARADQNELATPYSPTLPRLPEPPVESSDRSLLLVIAAVAMVTLGSLALLRAVLRPEDAAA